MFLRNETATTSTCIFVCIGLLLLTVGMDFAEAASAKARSQYEEIKAILERLSDDTESEPGHSKRGDVELLVEKSRAFIKAHPKYKQVDEVYYILALSFIKLADQTEEGIAVFEELIKDYRSSRYVENGLLELGLAYDRLGRHDKADETYEKLMNHRKYRSGSQAKMAAELLELDKSKRNGEVPDPYGAPARSIVGEPAVDLAQAAGAFPKHLEGPWTWVVVPTSGGLDVQFGASVTHLHGLQILNFDSLSRASDGLLTETALAKEGVPDDNSVGDAAWQIGKLIGVNDATCLFENGTKLPCGNNINVLVRRSGAYQFVHHSSSALVTNNQTFYGVLHLHSDVARSTAMFIGSDEMVKVWINGVVVHSNPESRPALGFQDYPIRVNLHAGDNLVVVKVNNTWGHWALHIGFEGFGYAVSEIR